MGWPRALGRSSITRQAAVRLAFSLGLFIVLLGLSSAYFYRTALHKAASERASDLAGFYQNRIAQLQHDWELHSRDFRVRIESARILEQTDTANVNLQAFLTLQGSERRFQYLLILNKNGDFAYAFGKDVELRAIPLTLGKNQGVYLDVERKALYQVFEEPIWLGENSGMGRVAFFFRIDNALLGSLATPDVSLSLLQHGQPLASSKGQAGIAADPNGKKPEAESRAIVWGDDPAAGVSLQLQTPVKALFSPTELVAGVSLILLSNGLILWFALGLWVMRQARRIKAMGNAVQEFSQQQDVTPRLQAHIRVARQGAIDEIQEVANAIQAAAEETVAGVRQRAEEAAQRRLWSSVFQSSGEAIIITDHKACIVAVNPAFQERMGYRLEEVAGKNPRFLSVRRESPVFYAAMWRQLIQSGFWQGEIWHRHKDGSDAPKLLSVSAVRGDDGAVENFVGYYTDISGRKRAEEELAHYQRHLEELVNFRTQALEEVNQELAHRSERMRAGEAELKKAQAVARVGSWYLDIRQNELRWSDETYRIFGLAPGTPVNYEKFLASIHPDDRAQVHACWQAAALLGAPYDIEHRIVAGDQVRWVRELADLDFDAQGALLGGVGTVQDITERKQQAAAIETLSALQRAIFNDAGNSIISTTTEGLITSFNRAAERMLGYQAEELVGKQTPAIIHDLNEVVARAAVLSNELGITVEPGFEVFVAKSRRDLPNDHEWTYVRKDGTRLPVLLTVTALRDSAGEITGFLGIATDISERKQGEAALLQAKEQAEAASQAKSAFLANMSHELRTPLNAILGFSQLLARDRQLSDSQHEQLGIINRSGEHLLGLINDILDVSKIEVGQAMLQPLDFDLPLLLQGLEEMFQARAEGKHLHCTLEIAAEVPRQVHADERKLRQVLINLLGNAVKFTQTGGVVLRVGLAPQAAATAGQRLLFAVEDSGPGIAAAELESIFEAFQQGSGNDKNVEGSGLGLSISRRLVHLMGGDIQVESRLGQGSLFSFDLPIGAVLAAPVAVQPAARVIGLAPGSPAHRLLVVDDKAVSRLLLRTLLESVGFVVAEAENGEQAVALWQSWQPHLIWMDLRMPVLDGYQATQRIKSLPGGADTVIVALTASAFAQDRDSVLAAGCDDFLSKPFKEQAIFDCLARHLDVHYLYEGEDARVKPPPGGQSALSAAALASLPADLAERLRQALIQGNLQRIAGALEEVRAHEPDLASALKQLAGQFAYQPILAWLQQDWSEPTAAAGLLDRSADSSSDLSSNSPLDS